MSRSMWFVSAALAMTTAGAPLPAQGGSTNTVKSLADLAWMAGSWAHNEGGKTSEEHWMKPAAGLMLGIHRDVEGTKTAFEFLRIEEKSGKITFLASPQGQPPTPFELVESSAQKAVFANPQHDFPQRILYWRDGKSLCAAIDGPMNGETVSEQWCWEPLR